MFPECGRMAVAPVRMCWPSIRVVWPTRTPGTSVMAFKGPGLSTPISTPWSRSSFWECPESGTNNSRQRSPHGIRIPILKVSVLPGQIRVGLGFPELGAFCIPMKGLPGETPGYGAQQYGLGQSGRILKGCGGSVTSQAGVHELVVMFGPLGAIVPHGLPQIVLL